VAQARGTGTTAPHAQAAVDDQWRTFLTGMAVTPGPIWVSDPASIRTSENKAHQMREAVVAGFRVPDTIWTNDAAEARAFLERWGNTAVVKSVASAWWEEQGEGKFVFARRISAADLPESDRLATAPLCFQQAIWPKRDVRVTIVGDRVFAAVRSDKGEDPPTIDWRVAGQGEWAPYSLRDGDAKRCRKLVEALGLLFGGIDIAVDERGNHWFLEINPNGEWGWLQRAGLPIAEALADTFVPTARATQALPAPIKHILLSTPVWRALPTPATYYLNRERVRTPMTMPSLPPTDWSRSERRALLEGAEQRLRNLEGKAPGAATISTVLSAGVVAATTAGWQESDAAARIVLGLAALYGFLGLLTPLYLVGPMRRSVIHVEDLVEASASRSEDELLADHAAEAAMSNDLANRRVGNMLDAARRELAYVLVLLAVWLVAVPGTGLLKRHRSPTRYGSPPIGQARRGTALHP